MYWKPIIGFDNYEVSDSGLIRTVIPFGTMIQQKVNSGGYYTSTLITSDERKFKVLVHRIVAEAFNPVDDMENLVVNHKDLYKLNNNSSNLEWVTNSENVKHYHESKIKKEFGSAFLEEIKADTFDLSSILSMLNHPFINKTPIAKILYPNNKQPCSALQNKINNTQNSRLTEHDIFRLKEILTDFMFDFAGYLLKQNQSSKSE